MKTKGMSHWKQQPDRVRRKHVKNVELDLVKKMGAFEYLTKLNKCEEKGNVYRPCRSRLGQ